MDSGPTTDDDLGDYAQFWLLGEEFKRDALRVRADERDFDPYALGRGEWAPPAPLAFTRRQGKRPYDVVGTSNAAVVLVSDRFVEVLSDNGFTGWKTFPVVVRADEGSEMGGLNGLQLTGRAGPIRDDLSEEVILPPPTPQGKAMPHLKGLYFEPGSWDGSDVFAPGESAFFVAREPVVDALRAAGVTNLQAERLTDVTRAALNSPRRSQAPPPG
jgi:hypothetical protein